MTGFFLLFAVVFVLNCLPAFAPPTWMALTLVGINFPESHPIGLALIAAAAATSGRVVLARLAYAIVRVRFMGQATRDNIDVLKNTVMRNQRFTIGTMLLYAICPLPSNYLFIAYGLTALPLRIIAIPFFCGRCIIYILWVTFSQAAVQRLDLENMGAMFGGYFIVLQLGMLACVYLFIRLDWRKLIRERRFGWIKR